MTAPPALLPLRACDRVLHISAVETPLIAEFVASLSHLERAAALCGTSGALVLPSGKSVTAREEDHGPFSFAPQLNRTAAHIRAARPSTW